MQPNRCRSVIHATLLAAALLAPGKARAQGDAFARVSVSITETYDGNLLATAAARDPQDDMISRFGPAVEAGYVSDSLQFDARYELDAERYLEHVALSKNVARQDAGILLRYLPSSKLALNVDASFLRTQTPGELNRDSQLAVGRARADHAAANTTLAYEWNGQTKVTLGYGFSRDMLAGAAASNSHVSSLVLERRTGLRNTVRARYGIRHAGFTGGGDGRSEELLNLVAAGWIHQIAPETFFEVEAGPHFTDRGIRPEISATLRRQIQTGEISLGYARTQGLTLGERGVIDVHRLAGTATIRPARLLSITTSPSLARSQRDRDRATAVSLDVEAVVEATRRLSVSVIGRLGRQKGTFADPLEVIPTQSLALKLMLTLPHHAQAVEPVPVE